MSSREGVIRASPPGDSRIWTNKKRALIEELEDAARRSPALRIMAVEDFGRELRALVLFRIKTLVRPMVDEVCTAGPVVAGIRYEESFLYEPPPPWGIVTIIEPARFFHPNSSPGKGLCLGNPPPAICLDAVLHLTWAALTLNSYNTVEWMGLDPVASAFVRANAAAFPLTPIGLFEEVPAHIAAGLDTIAIPPAAFNRSFIPFVREGGSR